MFMGRRTKRLETLRNVIFDHETMEIRFVVIEGRGQVAESQVPVSRESHLRRQPTPLRLRHWHHQSEDFPDFDKRSLESKESGKKYLDEFKKFWEEDPVLHRRGVEATMGRFR
jgi:hypothetical protein